MSGINLGHSFYVLTWSSVNVTSENRGLEIALLNVNCNSLEEKLKRHTSCIHLTKSIAASIASFYL